MKSYDDYGFLGKNNANMIGSILLFFIVLKYYGNILFSNAGFSVEKLSMKITIILSIILIINDVKKNNIFHFILLVLFFIQYKIIGNISIIYAYTLALALFNRDFKKILKVYITVNLVFFITCLVLNFIGIKPSGYVDGRNNLGFSNPNGAYMAFFIIWISYVYIKFYNLNKKDLTLLIISPIILYTETKTRTGLFTILGCISIMILFKNININKKIYKLIFTIYPIFLTIISLILAFAFNQNYWMNEYLSHRPYYWYEYLNHPTYGLNFIGYAKNIKRIVFGNARMPLDSGYIWTMYSGGLIAFLIILFLYAFAIYKLCNENKKAEVLLILSVLTYSFAESILLNISINISFVFIPYAIYKLMNQNKRFEYK